jgi:hypothetical protein
MPILIRAYRIPLAEVIAPLMQSAFGSISCNLGTAAFAAGPRFPRAVATQYRTESSGESSRDVISVTSASVTSLRLIFCVRLARRSAASVLASTVLSERTFTMVSLICFTSTGPPLASAMSTPADKTKQRARQSNLENCIFIPPSSCPTTNETSCCARKLRHLQHLDISISRSWQSRLFIEVSVSTTSAVCKVLKRVMHRLRTGS